MRSLNSWVFRQVAACLVLCLMFPSSEIGTAAAQQAVAKKSASNAPSPEGPPGEPATGSIIATNALPDSPEPASPQAEPQGVRDGSSQSSSSQQQQGPAQPVGTAAAPYEKTMGIAASRPAGAAIAPAKQRRVRTILISVGVIVAAGVAVGSVAALSHGSSSHPQ